MPYDRPTRLKLITDAIADLNSRVGSFAAGLRRSNLNVLARMVSGVVDGLYGYLAWGFKQLFVDTCDDSFVPIHASFWGVPQIGGSFASYSILVTGTSGAIVAAGSQLQRGDGELFESNVDVALINGQAAVAVTALTMGALGLTPTGSPLNFVTAIPGINAQASVQAGGADGVDVETVDSWRARIKQRVQNPPQGGSLDDYVTWAKEVPGVTRVWPLPKWLGAGTVGVAFAMDNATTAPIPDAGTVTAVQANIDRADRRPVTADVTAFAPAAYAVNYSIQLTPNNASTQAAVQAAIQALHQREAQFEDGTGSGTLLKSHIDDAIQLAAGVTDHVLTAPAGNVTPPKGSIATVGAFTWL